MKHTNNSNHKDLVTLREYFEEKFRLQDKAIELSREAIDRRLETMNAFREQINRIEGTLVTTKELDAKLEALERGKRDNLALIVSVLALLSGVIGIIIGLK